MTELQPRRQRLLRFRRQLLEWSNLRWDFRFGLGLRTIRHRRGMERGSGGGRKNRRGDRGREADSGELRGERVELARVDAVVVGKHERRGEGRRSAPGKRGHEFGALTETRRRGDGRHGADANCPALQGDK